MDLNTLLKPDAVKVLSSVTSKKRLLQTLGEVAHTAYGLDASETFAALQKRENLGRTGVGNGVALPHARLSPVADMTGAFILLENPVDFGSVDNRPVDIVFSLFAPTSPCVDHLKALALVSRTLRDQAFRSTLRANKDSSTLYELLVGVQKMAVA